jgi:chromosome segregation ATPase
LLAEVGKLQAEIKTIQNKLSALVDKHAKLDEEHNGLVKVLALSETDKVAMAEKLEAATKEVERLKAENTDLQKKIDEYVKSLKKQAEEWSVRFNGASHNAEIFKKEIDALSIDELKQKIETLKKQVAEKYPQGRHSQPNQDTAPKQPERPAHDRAELYKI